MFNDLSHFACGNEAGDIYIMKIAYQFDKQLSRAVFRDATVVNVLESKMPVISLNESLMNPNTLLTGHPNGNVCIWDYRYMELKKTIEQNKSGVSSLIV